MSAPIIPFVPPAVTPSPGVPPLFGGALSLPFPTLFTGSSLTVIGAGGQQQWGIFDSSGNPILVADAIEGVEYARDYRISDYPQEQGAFMSYNKVQVPYQAKVGFYVGLAREAFLASIEAQVASLGFVTVVTPEKTYANANLVHYGYRRVARRGMTLILVDVWLEEVRIASQAATTNAQGTNAQPTGDDGQLQADATTTQPNNATSGLPNLSAPPPSSPTALANPASSIGPAFYDQFNFPVVPNDAAKLAGPQIGAGLSNLGQQSLDGTGTLFVTPTPNSLSGIPDVSPATATIISEHP